MICQLILSNISKIYSHNAVPCVILSEISYTFVHKSTYGISGVSGAGKSTLLHILAGLDSPTSGSIYLNATKVTALAAASKEVFLQRLGFMFQQPFLINELTVLENVILKGLIENKPYAACEVEGRQLLEQVGLVGKQDSFPAMLSGGEQQRVALARALFNKPDFIIADEPTSNLDAKTGATIINLLLACQEQWQFGLIVCSHDQYVLDAMQTVLILEHGKLHDYKKNIVLQTRPSERVNTTQ